MGENLRGVGRVVDDIPDDQRLRRKRVIQISFRKAMLSFIRCLETDCLKMVCLETETQTETDAVQNSLQTIKQLLLHKVGYTGENHAKYRPFFGQVWLQVLQRVSGKVQINQYREPATISVSTSLKKNVIYKRKSETKVP